VLGKVGQARKVDLEAWETAMRVAVLAAGGRMLGELLEGIGSGRRSEPVICQCGARMKSRGLKCKRLSTILGEVPYRRSMYQCPACGETCYPGDKELDVLDTLYSPALRRMMARAGSKTPFKEACKDLKYYAAVEVTAKAVERVAEAVGEDMERWCATEHQEAVNHYEQELLAKQKTVPTLYIEMDGTGVPMVPYELKGRRGKQPDGSAKTREVKLGCVFTQTTVDEKGRAVRDPDSTTFVGKLS